MAFKFEVGDIVKTAYYRYEVLDRFEDAGRPYYTVKYIGAVGGEDTERGTFSTQDEFLFRLHHKAKPPPKKKEEPFIAGDLHRWLDSN